MKTVFLKRTNAATDNDRDTYRLSIPQESGKMTELLFEDSSNNEKESEISLDKRYVKWTDLISILKSLDVIVQE
jgi:hypothetical protein